MDEIRTILPSILQRLKDPDKKARGLLIDLWSSIAGEKLAKKTRPHLSSKGILYIHVDESVLAYEISQKYKPTFLKRAQSALGETAVKEVRVLVGK